MHTYVWFIYICICAHVCVGERSVPKWSSKMNTLILAHLGWARFFVFGSPFVIGTLIKTQNALKGGKQWLHKCRYNSRIYSCTHEYSWH